MDSVISVHIPTSTGFQVALTPLAMAHTSGKPTTSESQDNASNLPLDPPDRFEQHIAQLAPCLAVGSAGVGKVSVTTGLAGMDMMDDIDMLSQLESLEARAFLNIENQKKKSIETAMAVVDNTESKASFRDLHSADLAPNPSTIENLQTGDDSFADFDFDALEALEKSAMDKISQLKHVAAASGSIDAGNNHDIDMKKETAIYQVTSMRLIALNIVSQFNAVTGQREKLIRCMAAGEAEGQKNQMQTLLLCGDDW